jgi:2-polyprenyl-6-methoxyphenol hydroxylase-like FAD-dependent oxidoreductase
MSITTPAAAVGEHAVVLGASMAGLLAARVLSESFRRVTVVERDTLPDEASSRRGVPQSLQVHALLARGRQLLDSLFPDLDARLVADGALLVDGTGSFRFVLNGHRLPRIPKGTDDIAASRILLEHHVRESVRALPSVTFREGCDALRPIVDGERVTGVEIRDRASAAVEVLAATALVDATGRGSRTPTWLAEMGRTAPTEDRIVVNLGYTTGRFRLRPGALAPDAGLLITPTPDNPRSGSVIPVENGEVTAVVAGTMGDHPPTGHAAFLEFAATLPAPDLREALEGAELLGPLRPARFPANTRRRYEQLTDLPHGLFVLGDALCSFNPIYGQGMTVAAIEADVLRRLLARGRVPTPRHYFRAAARALAPAWDLAVGSDLQDPRVDGPRPRGTRIVNAYVARIQAAAVNDPDLTRTFLAVSQLLQAPTALLRPDRVARVLWSTDRRRTRTTRSTPIPT